MLMTSTPNLMMRFLSAVLWQVVQLAAAGFGLLEDESRSMHLSETLSDSSAPLLSGQQAAEANL